MGFKDLLKKAGQVTKKAIDRAGKEVKWRKRVGEAKREILTRFSVRQLKRIAASKGISLVYEDPITGERQRLTTKAEIVGKLARNLGFEEVVDLARRYKVRYSDIVQELEKFRQELFEEVTLEDKTSGIIELIKEFEPVGTVNREDDLKFQLAQWLSARFGKNAVKLEYPFEHGKIDILVNDSIAIELKIASSKQKLKNLVGEVNTDKMYFSSVIAVIFDVGKDIGLDFFVNQIKALGAITIVIPAQVKKSRRRQEIIIKQGRKKIIIR